MSQAKDRLYRRLEKFVITLECFMIGIFLGGCVLLAIGSKLSAGCVALIVFVFELTYKRHVIDKERRHG